MYMYGERERERRINRGESGGSVWGMAEEKIHKCKNLFLFLFLFTLFISLWNFTSKKFDLILISGVKRDSKETNLCGYCLVKDE